MENALHLYRQVLAMKVSLWLTKFVRSLGHSLVRRQSVEVLIWPCLSVIISEIYGEFVFNNFSFSL